MLSLQEKLDAAKAAHLIKLEKHIIAECEAWEGWDTLTEIQKANKIADYEYCYFAGFEAAMSVISKIELRLPNPKGG